MSEFGHSTVEEAKDFAEEHSIDLGAGLAYLRMPIQALLVRFSESGDTTKHLSNAGADYLFSQLDYFTDAHEHRKRQGSQMIATILAGKRTELAYWTEAAPKKEITIHQGLGNLAVGNPADNKITIFQLDPEVTPEVILPSGRFYALHAHPWTPKPLVVSGLYGAEKPVDWEEMEVTFEPGQETVEAPEGAVEIPAGFHDMFRRHGG